MPVLRRFTQLDRGKAISIISAMAMLVALCALSWFIYSGKPELEIYFFDIGQGDAALVRTPYGQNILVDGGPDKSILRELGKAMPWWDRTIDLMILSHPHDDHSTGQYFVMDRFDVKKILYNAIDYYSPNYEAWLEIAAQEKAALAIADHPQRIYLGEDCRIDLLYPFTSLAGKKLENQNNTSITAKLDCGGETVLFTGDIESEIEAELVRSGTDLKADVLKVPHHGSDTSCTEAFLDAVKPKFASISAGADNEFGHPTLRVVSRLERNSIKTLRTDRAGTIRFKQGRLAPLAPIKK